MPHRHHQNSIHKCLHHSATNCILLFLFHVVQYPQTEKWKTSESGKKAHSTQAISRNKQNLMSHRIFYYNFIGIINTQ